MPEQKPIFIEISPGELIDRITILEIKTERIADSDKRKNVSTELKALQAVRTDVISPCTEIDALTARLRQINAALWEVEDRLRECERTHNFGPAFVDLARSVYRLNDQRADAKRQINTWVGARLTEEKSYTDY